VGQQELAFGMSDIQQFAGADVMPAATKYAQRITNCPRKTVDSIIECGRLLIAAKDELKHGEFLKMIENNLPFKRSTAQALMKIANDKRITKNQHVGCLPAHWSTLVKLTQLPDAAFEARIADGRIHSGLERRPAVEMIESYFSSLPKRGDTLNASTR
jgi:Protein of unknown function (DUF3102)